MEDRRAERKRVAAAPAVKEKLARPALGDITNARARLDDAAGKQKKKTQAQHEHGPVTRSASAAVAAKTQKSSKAQPRTSNESVESTATPMDLSDINVDIGTEEQAPVAVNEKAKSKLPKGVDDIDSGAPEYMRELYGFLREKELDANHSCDPDYLNKKQKNLVNGVMRGILVDWLIELHWRLPRRIAKACNLPPFQFSADTLFLAVSLLDRYLSHKAVSKDRLQLVGVAAFLIASKYEEVVPPEVGELAESTAGTFTAKQVLEMESEMITVLKWRVVCCGPSTFLRRFLEAGHADDKISNLAWFLCERALLEVDMLHFRPSLIAASAVYLARLNLQYRGWSPTLAHYSQYSEEDLKPCLQCMSQWISRRSSTLKVVWTKYKGSIDCMQLQGV